MVQTKSCNDCSQAHDCRKIYQQLGHVGGSSVTLKAIVAFVLPIVFFVTALAALGHLLNERFAERYQTPVVFALSLSITVGLMVVVSVVIRGLHKE